MDRIAQTEHDRIFHLFSRLPAELRWKIWEYSLPGPRLVAIRCGADGLGCPSSLSSSSPFSAGCTSPARIPANLHASHESRREALRHYHAAFGIAHHPSQIFFSAPSDILYFGPRDGFMASEAQLRTVLTMCDPTELARVQKVAISDAVFWLPAGRGGSAGTCTAKMGVSLLVDVLLLLRARMTGLRELVFVPRDENPLYSRYVCLVQPAMLQSPLVGIVKEAMAVVFVNQRPSERPWDWRIMMLVADADVHLHSSWPVLGLHAAKERDAVEHGNVHSPGYVKPDWKGEKHWAGKRQELTRLNLLQESVRRDLMHMDAGAHAVPVVVE
ncbi:hypothetical protein N0V82_000999 [Gnomoniopsis sp. IMI 355080]|nr:hypothetical protein N0V82_000999 [Gnomoniopsis sp. IMI 355080]